MRFPVVSGLLCLLLTPLACLPACAQSSGSNPPPAAKQEKPAPLTPEQQELDQLLQEGNAAYYKADFPTAEKAYQSGLEKAQVLKDERRTAHFLNNLGNVYYHLGQFEKASDYYTRALSMREKLGIAQDTAVSLNCLGTFYYSLGKFDKASESYTRALAINERLGNEEGIAASLMGLGIVYDSLGQLDKALDYGNRALIIHEKLGNQKEVSECLNNLGNIYDNLGQFHKALDFYKRALTIQERLGNQQDVAYFLGNLGTLYADMRQFEKALDSFTRALTINEKLGNEQDIASNLDNLGNIYNTLGQLAKALELHKRALAVNEKLNNEHDIARNLDNLGIVYADMGQFEKALNFCTRSLAIREKLGSEQEIILTLNNLGSIYSNLRRFDKAKYVFQQAIERYEHLQERVNDASQLGSLQSAEQSNPSLLYAAFLAEQHHPALALQYAERGRGQGLALQALHNRTDLSVLFSPTDVALRHQKQIELTLSSSLWQAVQDRPIPSDKTEQQALLQQQKQAEQHYRKAETDWEAFEASMRLKYPRYRQLQGFAPPSPVQLAALAHDHPDTLFVECAVVNDKQSLLFALSYKGLKAFRLSVGNKALQNLAKDWKDALVANSSEEPALAQKLCKTVFASLDKAGLQGKGFSHLVVVADGPLLDIPFAALMDSKGRRLVERFAVSSAFSLGSLIWPQEKRASSATLLCAADPIGKGEVVPMASRGGKFTPLPAARDEINHILPLFVGTKTVAYMGHGAQRERIQHDMSQYALLHFATHGVADGTIGLRSGLLLADDKAEAKYSVLEAREIAGMRLSAQMAVLSACGTAEGQKSGGDGILGLAWAFRAAGCPSIVASQWEVNDEATGQLMLAFYKALKAGKRKDEALRQAMLAVKREKPSPFYWAAFQVMGDTQPLHLSSMARRVSQLH